MLTKLAVLSLVLALAAAKYQSEIKIMPGHTRLTNYRLPMPHEYTNAEDMPASFDWSNVNGTSYLTKSLNQHIPQYCGSCWAHGAMSALADRIKIARGAKGVDINLAIQYILNCGTDIAGSCHGGSATGAYQFVKESGHVPYDTCLQYEACSSESTEGNCGHGNYECKPINVCRTCSTFTASGGKCQEIEIFPNATIAEYGTVPGSVHALKSEIYQRGPVAAGVNAEPILEYMGGVFDDPSADKGVNHIVSITGWGVEPKTNKEYWIVRNSWGEYWGELGYFRIATGDNQLGIEDNCSWATVDTFTELNFPCYESGDNCVKQTKYVDPAVKLASSQAKKLISNALRP
jgi:cathepsin X